jgi:glutamate-1-semialdehyde 2,1-aminomutase
LPRNKPSDSPTSMKPSEGLFETAQRLFPGGVNSPVRAFRSVGGTPFFTERAEGAYLYTADGTQLIDYVCTWGPAINGHNAPAIREAVTDALAKGTSFGTPNPLEVELGQRVIDWVPSLEQVRFTNSGTEATMSALRLARGFTGRDRVVKFAGCYHGHVDSLLVKAGSGALTLGNPDSAGVPAAFAEATAILEYNDTGALEAFFANEGETVAAVIIEPYPANCGLLLPKEGFLERLRALCTQYGTLLIFDEVMTGFRIAPGGVQSVTGICPDLTALGKIIGGGLPVGAFGGRKEVMQHLAPVGPVYQAGTLSGNPLAMAAGCAALDLLKATNPYPRLEAYTHTLAGELIKCARAKGLPLQVPQAASMFALFFAEEPVTSFAQVQASATGRFVTVFQNALSNGVYLPPSPYETCFVSAAHSEADLEQTIDVLTTALKAL